jgi:hypothetical protein
MTPDDDSHLLEQRLAIREQQPCIRISDVQGNRRRQNGVK